MQRKWQLLCKFCILQNSSTSMRSQGHADASHWVPWTWTHVISRKQLIRIAATHLSSATSACPLRYIELCEGWGPGHVLHSGPFWLGTWQALFWPLLSDSGPSVRLRRHACLMPMQDTPDICRAAAVTVWSISFGSAIRYQSNDASYHTCMLIGNKTRSRSISDKGNLFVCLSKLVSLDCHHHIVYVCLNL